MQEPDNENTDGTRQHAVADAGKKMYYSITEVCAATGLKPHILRYWENEFSLLRPKKNSGGKRVYREKDIETVVRIKRMLSEEKYTLQGAKDKLSEERRELRAGGSAAAKKRGEAAAAAKESTTPEPAPVNDNAGGTGDGGSGNKALLSSIRDGLSEVLGLLET
jgi:DNA-binding transcriptional MerR regulator